jgi:hypothetical protein
MLCCDSEHRRCRELHTIHKYKFLSQIGKTISVKEVGVNDTGERINRLTSPCIIFTRETREGRPLLTDETEANGDL